MSDKRFRWSYGRSIAKALRFLKPDNEDSKQSVQVWKLNLFMPGSFDVYVFFYSIQLYIGFLSHYRCWVSWE